MKKICTGVFHLLVFIIVLSGQQGCVKDTCSATRTYVYFVPEYKTKNEVRANIKSNAPRAITEPGKLTIKDNYIYLNELNKGIHVIDNSNPANPRNVAFIDIPGNVDIAVKNNLLYADLYTDLVVLDIADPLQVRVKQIADHIFPERYYFGYVPDTTKIVCNWVRREEEFKVDCNGRPYNDISLYGVALNNAAAGAGGGRPAISPVGINGSMARFALVNDYLYTVSSFSLKVMNLNTRPSIKVDNEIMMGAGIETIYPFKDKLFVGASNGMFIYNLQNPALPSLQSNFIHATACDPVIADDNTAFVTLRSGSRCNSVSNQLEVLSISNIQAPQLLRIYPLTNPRGLSKDGNLLFVCDGTAGLRVFNAADRNALTQIALLPMGETYDVIAWNNVALVVAKDGLYQYDYSNPSGIRLLSKIPVTN